MKYSVIVAVLVGIIVIVLLTLNKKSFKTFSLLGDNTVTSYSVNPYLDTILLVGMEVEGITKQRVIVKPLSASKLTYDEGTKAHIQYWGGIFYMYVDDLSVNEAFFVLGHEVVHMKQYLSGRLYPEGNAVFWDGHLYPSNMSYHVRPWETEAFNQQDEVAKKILNFLY